MSPLAEHIREAHAFIAVGLSEELLRDTHRVSWPECRTRACEVCGTAFEIGRHHDPGIRLCRECFVNELLVWARVSGARR